MTTILKCSILTILKLEKLQIHPIHKTVLRNDVRYCVRKREFTIQPEATIATSEHKSLEHRTTKLRRKLSIRSFILFALAIFLFSIIVKLTFPYPLHASCLVKWEFGEPCDYVIQRMRSQIVQWSNYKYCGFKCLYKITNVSPQENNTIRAFRIHQKYNVIDDIDMVFSNSPTHRCTALAESNTRYWYAIFDDGRNYCNLHDLIVGAGYEGTNYFLEFTNNLICTQYDMAYCD